MKQLKRLMAILLAFVLCITSGGLYLDSYASDTSVSREVSSAKVVENVIHISTAEELAKIGTSDEYPLDGNYVLDCDIDLSNYGNWTPIGFVSGGSSYAYKTATTGFTGTFDGNGHTISGMNAVGIDHSYNYVGLFGVVHKTAEIKNIRFKDCIATATAGVSAFAGIVAGAMYPDSTETLSGGTSVDNVCIEDCTVIAKGRNFGNQTVAGSVVGYGDCVTMQNIWSNADVIAMYDYSENGHSQQIIAGGIVGSCWIGDSGGRLSLTNCVFAGTLDASDHYNGDEYACTEECAYERTGAMLGANTRGISGSTIYVPNVANSNCYYASDIANVNTYNQNAFNGIAMITAELKNALSSTHMNSNESWYNDAEDGLKLVIGREFDATNFADYTALWDADDLASIKNNLAGKYVLAQDVNMVGYGNWTPIGYYSGDTAGITPDTAFTGILDGNSHKIIGMTVSQSGTRTYVGLIGSTYGAAEIKNIAFENCEVSGTGSVTVYAAIVVGYADRPSASFADGAKISNIFIENSTVSGTSQNANNPSGVASIAGSGTYSTISNCYSNAMIIGTCTATGNIQFGNSGMVGQAWRGYVKATNCVFNGTIDASGITGSDVVYCNGIFALNPNHATYATNTNNFVNCYYNSDNLTVSTATNGGEINGIALNTVDFGIRSIETLGLDSTYWIHTGYQPVLAISGETVWDGTPDVNGDGIVDICDLVRNKVFAEDNTIENVLYRATNMAEATADDAVAVDSNDIAQMRTYLLENVDIYLNNTTAGNFKLLGNTVANTQEFYMDWSYTGFSFEAYAIGDVDVDFRYISQNAFPYAKLAIIIDGNVENREVIEISADGTYTITTVEAGYHTFEVVKLTERTHDILKADKLSFKGMLKPAPADAELNIQFIGDSITAASALASYTKGNAVEEQAVQDILQGYAYQTATFLDADLSVYARSGIKTSTAAMDLLPANATSEYDIVVIGLGTNDNTGGDVEKQATLKADVITMLTNARTAYPNAKIVWIYGMMIAIDNDTIKAAVNEFNATDGNAYYFDGFTANQEGGAGHPNAVAHMAAAKALATYLNNLIQSYER